MSITIGSINLWNYGGGSEKKKPKRVAQIIADAGFNVVAMQEILDEDAARRIADELGLGWQYAWAKPGSGRDAKGYAFLWDTNRCVPVSAPAIYEDAVGLLTRPPFVGCFEFETFHIQLINTQIFSKGHKSFERSDVKQQEYKQLCGPIYRRIDDAGRVKYLPTYTIVLGDFNMLPAWCDECHQDPDFIRECDGRRIVCEMREATSLKQDGSGYMFSIDHFSFDSARIPRSCATVRRIDATGDLGLYREEVSDHVPIGMELVLG